MNTCKHCGRPLGTKAGECPIFGVRGCGPDGLRANARSGPTWEATISANDPLNPGFGIFLQVTENGRVRFHSDRHPVTGDTLTYHTALLVAAMYGPKQDDAAIDSMVAAHVAQMEREGDEITAAHDQDAEDRCAAS